MKVVRHMNQSMAAFGPLEDASGARVQMSKERTAPAHRWRLRHAASSSDGAALPPGFLRPAKGRGQQQQGGVGIKTERVRREACYAYTTATMSRPHALISCLPYHARIL